VLSLQRTSQEAHCILLLDTLRQLWNTWPIRCCFHIDKFYLFHLVCIQVCFYGSLGICIFPYLPNVLHAVYVTINERLHFVFVLIVQGNQNCSSITLDLGFAHWLFLLTELQR